MEYIKFSEFIRSTQYGYTAEETSMIEGDSKYLRITDIVPYFINKERVPFCKIDEKKKEKYLVKKDDLLIARTGATTGYNVVIDNTFNNFVFASYLIRFNYDKDALSPVFLKYVLKSQQWYGFVNNYIGGSAQPGMNAKVFGKFEIPYFNIERQERIASILIAYDNLIENNNKRIHLLEQMAENLYKEWFVRFRFPGYEDAEFDNGVPKNWEYSKLINFIDVRYGKDHKNIEEGTIPILGSGGIMRYGDRALYNGEAVLIPRKGSLNNIMYINGDFWTVDTLFYSIPKIKNIARYLYFTFKYFDMDSLNSGASIPSMTTDIIYHLKMRQPDATVLEMFDEVLKPIYEEMDILGKQNDSIKNQRDMLLPRLMSGKLEV